MYFPVFLFFGCFLAAWGTRGSHLPDTRSPATRTLSRSFGQNDISTLNQEASPLFAIRTYSNSEEVAGEQITNGRVWRSRELAATSVKPLRPALRLTRPPELPQKTQTRRLHWADGKYSKYSPLENAGSSLCEKNETTSFQEAPVKPARISWLKKLKLCARRLVRAEMPGC
jgi:hypothetical protein